MGTSINQNMTTLGFDEPIGLVLVSFIFVPTTRPVHSAINALICLKYILL